MEKRLYAHSSRENDQTMENLETKLFQGLLGMTVYSPDVWRSGISEDVDEFIARHTGLCPVLRHQIRHTAASIERFYATGVHKNVPNWHYVVKFFTGGPSLITFWYGEEAIDRLNAIKGRSHPSLASDDTVRGHFLCDNAICNLIHTSDDISEMLRELTAAECYGLLKIPFTGKNVSSSFFNEGKKELKHNGAFTFLKVLQRVADIREDITPDSDMGSAKFYNAVIEKLSAAAQTALPQVRKMIAAFLKGDETVVDELEKYGATDEERFIIASSAATRSGWEPQVSLHDAVYALVKELDGVEGFFIGGSTAARLYGYKCVPDDIDVICTDDTLEIISEKLDLKIETAEKNFGTYRFCAYRSSGYEVEFSTMANYKNNYNIVIDEEMLARSAGTIPLMPPEDMICELYSLGRTDYHDDIDRAKKYLSFFGSTIDGDYLKKRFISSGIGEECLADLMK